MATYQIRLSNGGSLVWIDERQVKLPHLVPTVGHDKWIAKPGDLIAWNDTPGYGKVVGRMAEPLRNEDGTILIPEGWLVVLMLGRQMSHSYFRTIKPENVTCCTAMPTAHLAWFAASKVPPDVLAEMVHYGSTSEEYVGTGEERARIRMAWRRMREAAEECDWKSCLRDLDELVVAEVKGAAAAHQVVCARVRGAASDEEAQHAVDNVTRRGM